MSSFLFTGAVTRVRPMPMPNEESSDDDEESDGEDVDEPRPKKSRMSKPDEPRREWKKEDISHEPLPQFHHRATEFLRSPIEYFQEMFPVALVEDIVFQTNLYARQKNVNTTFSITLHEMMVFIGIVLYMGICVLPCIEDYWGTYTRVPQVAEAMSSKRFRLIRSLLHFNNNENARGNTDRFFKVRPLFSAVTRQFLKVPETPTQSVDEVMVSYKGTRAGTLRQYIQTKPDKWGYKLFCRASIDGFIHDILMYQGESTFSTHHTQLSPQESLLQVSMKTVITLAKTLKNKAQSAIYADNYFTSFRLVKYLRDVFGVRYVGTARVNRVGQAPLKTIKDMSKKGTARGEYDYCSMDGILALRWKDNKNVTVLSSDVGVEPMAKVKRYDRSAKKKVDVPCPRVIKEYNGKMGGIDKSDMLTHLYKTPMRARRWYMRLFGYIIDLCVCNAWLLYKRDCVALKVKPMPLKNFRLEISQFARAAKSLEQRSLRSSPTSSPPSSPVASSRRGIRTEFPAADVRFQGAHHLPVFMQVRQTCKYCSTKAVPHRTRWMCTVCKIALCLSDTRNCFVPYHTPPSDVSAASPRVPPASPSTSATSP